MDRRSPWVFLILLLWSLPAPASHLGREKMKVVKVIHGDTLRVQWKGKTQTLILLGVDTPPALLETPLLRRARLLKMDPHTLLKMGKEAKEATQKLIPPQEWIYVEFDWIKRDPQGRLMGYVYVSQGMLNAILIAQGYARARLSFPFPMRPKKEEIFSTFPFLERKARREKRGLWRYGRF
jgi:micrococcal nuclease